VNERGYPVSTWRTTYVDGYLLHKVGRVGQDGRAVLRLKSITNSYVNEVQDD